MNLKFFEIPEPMKDEPCCICGFKPDVLVAEATFGGGMVVVCKKCLEVRK